MHARAYSLDLRERVGAAVGSGHRSTALRPHRRALCHRDDPVNGESFLAYVEQILLPTPAPGDIVVMDNLGSRKGRAVRDAIHSAGVHRLLLPHYSPDLNPIEQALAKLKALLRKAGEPTVEATDEGSATCSATSHPANAPTISATPAMLQFEMNRF